MRFWTSCSTPASRRYLRRVIAAAAFYMVILFVCIRVVRTIPIHGWALYAIALLPAVPVLGILVIQAVYLQEETDEYLRMVTVRSLMVAAGAMLAIIVVNDFLRVIAQRAALTPFFSFTVFFLSFALAQGVQEAVLRGASDE